MKQSVDAQMVKTALASLQFLIAKPSELFDPYASLAKLLAQLLWRKKRKTLSRKQDVTECPCKTSSVEAIFPFVNSRCHF